MPTALYQKSLAELQTEAPDAEISAVTYQVSQDFFDAQKDTETSDEIKGFTSVMVFSQNDEIVLARKSYGAPGWAMPGGGVELDETFHDCARREILEELGVRLDELELVMIEEETWLSPTQESSHSLLAVFAGRMRKFALPPLTDEAKEEGLELALFDPFDLPAEMALTDREKIEAFLEEADDSSD
jgi:8-oxo-dGTP pyrophosphatase MutT (NUDIX family)